MCVVKKVIFIVHSNKSNDHGDIILYMVNDIYNGK